MKHVAKITVLVVVIVVGLLIALKAIFGSAQAAQVKPYVPSFLQ